MKKIETTLVTLIEDIGNFYEPTVWHFLTLNGIDLGNETIELQWIFSKYAAKEDAVVFYAITDFKTSVPSIVSLIPSAIMGEREVVDMFGVEIEGALKGLYLDKDSKSMPLRCSL